MLDRRDPEFLQISKARKSNYDQAWRMGLIGDSAYVLSLAGIGYSNGDAVLELRMLQLDKSRENVHRRAAWC